MSKVALITGITGQDGSYLAELLLGKGYEVHGIIRRSSTFNTSRIDHIFVDPHDPNARLFLHYGDLSDSEQISNIIYNVKPAEVYHLGAQSHVRASFDMPEYSGNVTALGTTRILEAIRRSGNEVRFYQASSSEMFWSSPPPQNEHPEDFVIGTGEAHSVREFLEEAFSYAGLDMEEHVKIDPRYFRPTETEVLIADPANAIKKLGWNPKIKFNDLVKIMVDADMRAVGLEPIGEGNKLLKKKFPNRWWGLINTTFLNDKIGN